MRNIVVESLKNIPVSEQQIEIVERKGVGHPDYICDAVMDGISVALSREYIKSFGDIMHHNVDKGLLVAGGTNKRFGGGEVTKPMELIIGDRATREVGGKMIDVNTIAINAAKEWIKKNLRFVDPDAHLTYRVVLFPGSEELTGIFKTKGAVRAANDTSAAVGYAPLSETEKAVLQTENYLNSKEFKRVFPDTGEDIKVMGFRNDRELNMTIAMPFICKYIESEEAYFKRKDEALEAVNEFVGRFFLKGKVNIYLNTLDKKGKGMDGMYLSLLGTSAEDADSGQVGRGNRVNGVIALNRPMGTEAAAGKNPVSHVGKIYNILTHRIANEIYKEVKGIKEVYVWLCSQIGVPIDHPKIASAHLILEQGVSFGSVSKKAEDVIDSELKNIARFCAELAEGKYPVC
ncbi:MAG: methionine adenosyltransferase [Nitrospinae bacterium]|nr:methionine adenosyltransferase [Nitrospinota bacterium]